MINFIKAEEQHQHKNGGGWVANTAKVEEIAYIGPNAQVYGYAQVSGDAKVYGDAQVYDDALVYGDAQVSGDAQVYGDARVSGDAKVYGDARVYGDAWVCGDARVSGDAWVYGDAWENSPLYIQGTKHGITNCAYGEIAIGCQVHTFAEWKKNYKAIGKAAGYTPAQIKEYAAHIALIVKLGKKSKKENK
jgi:carbonic anhydrase/acetyltransferase-like protein (isoleucine patch superfamily)